MKVLVLLLIPVFAFAKTADTSDCSFDNPIANDERIIFEQAEEAGGIGQMKVIIPQISGYSFRDAYVAVITSYSGSVNHGVITELSTKEDRGVKYATYTYSTGQSEILVSVQASYNSNINGCLLSLKNEKKHNKSKQQGPSAGTR